MNLGLLRQALSHVLSSRAIVDQIALPNDLFVKYREGITDLNDWVNLFKHFDPKKPHTWVKTGLSVAQRISVPKKEIEAPTRNLISRFLESQGLVKVDQFNALPFYQDIIQKNFKASRVVVRGEEGILRMFPLAGVEEPFFFFELKNPVEKRGREYTVLPFLPDMVKHTERRIRMSKALCAIFWSDKKHLKLTLTSDNMEYTVVNESDRKYEGQLTELYSKLDRYYRDGVRRVVLFDGPPGTGKSTLALNLAEALSERTLVVTHATLEWVTEEDWTYFQDMLQPEMIVVDDIDRLGNLLQKKLFLFEEKTCAVPMVILTSNHIDWLPDAFKRPGRIDQIVEMETPSDEIRKEVVLKIAALEGVTVPDHKIDVLDQIHRKYSGAYIVELLRRVKVEGWDYQIPSYDRTFNDLSQDIRTAWNEGQDSLKTAPAPEDISYYDFE